MSTFLVTGGAGFIGSHLVDALLKLKNKVFVLDDLSAGKRFQVNKKARFIKAAIQSNTAFKLVRNKNFDYIYHCAAQKNLQYSKEFPLEDAKTNIMGSINILNALKGKKHTKIIFFSSAAVYDQSAKQPVNESTKTLPITPYGIGKLAVEYYIRQSGIPFTILRPSNVYGPRQDGDGEGGVIAVFSRRIAQHKSPIIHNTGRQTRDFIYIDDIVRACITAMHKANGEVVNVSTGKQTAIIDIFRQINLFSGSRLDYLKGRQISEQKKSSLARVKAKRVLNWIPRMPLDRGLRLTYQWFKDN